MPSADFCEMLIERTGVVVVPGVGYGKNGEGYFRIALTKDEKTIQEAMERIKKAGIKYQ